MIEKTETQETSEVLVIFPEKKKGISKIGGLFKNYDINYEEIEEYLKKYVPGFPKADVVRLRKEGIKISVKEMIKKEIDNLPENLLTEVFDFIQFLESKRERTLLAKASQELPAALFQKIWDNEEDAIYDKL
ncbi:MAG: hypothetical protein U0586_06080 [Candidatus Brocadiaceae bacterium]